MQILNFKFDDPSESGFKVSPLELRPNINLFVGLSGSGKSQILNILMNIGVAVAQGGRRLSGKWSMLFEHNSQRYLWEYEGLGSSQDEMGTTESLFVISPESDGRELIYVRSDSDYTFQGQKLPKIAGNSVGIFIFREEDRVRDAYDGFTLIQRRLFQGDDLAMAAQIQAHPYQLFEKLSALKKRREIHDVWARPMSLHVRLFVLEKFFPDVFRAVEREFISVFPGVIAIAVGAAAKHLPTNAAIDAPLALIKEKGVPKPTPINEISSGMLKVLLIITDILCSPDHIIYMVDEYENSLGVNAINFLPTFLMEHGGSRQVIVTSHHPFLINNIPIQDWFVFRRDGLRIDVTPGSVLREKYGRSKQQQFIQLLNDPAYEN